jgi:hypothetical protein
MPFEYLDFVSPIAGVGWSGYPDQALTFQVVAGEVDSPFIFQLPMARGLL